ncbi:FG-GAP repeat domain-containing protein [Cohnella cellulosilytica]|uniref:FG-GAP repeat domain-containing protein n=1 Tax=Cohnella cellulosilytica TaxID=986710 RepID=A0ABW2F5X2_9BACL
MIDLKLRRLGAAALLGALMIAAACGSGEKESGSPAAGTQASPAGMETAASLSASGPAASPDASAEPESDKPDERQTSLPERLQSELDGASIPEEQFAEWLRSRAEQDNPGDDPITVVRADLDGDGLAREWAAVVYENRLIENAEYRYAYGIVAALRSGEYEWQSFIFPEEDGGRASILDTGDLNGDGKPEIVWASLGIGAHTSTFTYTISGWNDGKLDRFQGAAIVPTVTEAGVRDGKLVVSGGLINSAGAGPWQREYTDTYTIADGAIKRTSRIFTEAATPFQRLLDGLWAEADGDAKGALRHYEAAAAMKAESYRDFAFIFGSDWVEGGTMEDEEKKFEEVVHRFAGFRRERLNAISQGQNEENACAAAKKKSGYDASWIAYLNAPAGYANPVWSDDTVCAAIDEQSGS